MNKRFWNIFHDGNITQILGKIPGDLIVTIELPYIRERFSEPGNTFDLVLHKCSKIAFFNYATGQNLVDIENLRSPDLEVLCAEMSNDWMEVVTSPGILRVHYDDESIRIGVIHVDIAELEIRANAAVAEFVKEWRESGRL